MKILFLAPRFPLPADTGGKIRTLNIIKQMSKWAKIKLVCFSFEEKDWDRMGDLKNMGVSTTLIPANTTGLFQKIFNALFNPTPHTIAKYISSMMERAVTQLNQEEHFDAVHIDHLHMAHYRRFVQNLPCVVDEHNVEYKILERCASVERSPLKKILYYSQAYRMKLFEAKNTRKFSACLTVSLDDRDMLIRLSDGKVPVYVVPNGVDTEYFQTKDQRLKTTDTSEESLVFTGSMDWLPNEDAAVYFCKEILPRIWKQKPQVKFYIVGKDPSPKVTAAASADQRIILTGGVEDVRPYIEKSKIFVVPLRIGGGTRLKILEAMAMQKAVVSTSLGAEGIAYIDNVNIVLADKPSAFAERVVKLLDDNEKIKQLSINGRKLVCDRYDWNIVGKKLQTMYQGICVDKKSQ